MGCRETTFWRTLEGSWLALHLVVICGFRPLPCEAPKRLFTTAEQVSYRVLSGDASTDQAMTPANDPEHVQDARADQQREPDQSDLRKRLLAMIRHNESLRRDKPRGEIYSATVARGGLR